MWEALSQGLGTNGPAAVTALFFVGLAGLIGGSLPFVLVLSFLIYLGMTLITYEWSREVSSAYSWAAYHKEGVQKNLVLSSPSLVASVTGIIIF
jgi:hypothetical protein